MDLDTFTGILTARIPELPSYMEEGYSTPTFDLTPITDGEVLMELIENHLDKHTVEFLTETGLRNRYFFRIDRNGELTGVVRTDRDLSTEHYKMLESNTTQGAITRLVNDAFRGWRELFYEENYKPLLEEAERLGRLRGYTFYQAKSRITITKPGRSSYHRAFGFDQIRDVVHSLFDDVAPNLVTQMLPSEVVTELGFQKRNSCEYVERITEDDTWVLKYQTTGVSTRPSDVTRFERFVDGDRAESYFGNEAMSRFLTRHGLAHTIRRYYFSFPSMIHTFEVNVDALNQKDAENRAYAYLNLGLQSKEDRVVVKELEQEITAERRQHFKDCLVATEVLVKPETELAAVAA